MWSRIEAGRVAEIIDFDPKGKFHGSLTWVQCGGAVEVGDIYKDGEFSKPVSVLTNEEKIAQYRAAVGRRIDRQAQSFGFDSIVTAVTYADEPADPLNQSYGQALRAWRSKCWEKCREVLTAWQGGGAEPTVEELIASLPVFEGP